MIEVLLSLSVIATMLVLSELLLKGKVIHGEISRKFVHIITGSFIASWAFYLSVREIQLISLLLLIGVIVSKNLNIFRSVHSVSRKTSGEIFYALSVGIIATISPNAWVFAAAILIMSLADGLAAVVGSAHGKSSTYKVFGHKKSLIGTGIFYIVSMIIIFVVADLSPEGTIESIWLTLFWVPIIAAAAENLSFNGLDNLFVPLVVVATIGILNAIAI